jgi:hypothetical protein
MFIGLGRGPPGRAMSAGLGRPGPRLPPGRGPPAAWPGRPVAGPPDAEPDGAADGPGLACDGCGPAPMPVAVELKGLFPGLGPRGGPGRAPGARGAPDGGLLPGACGPGPGLRPVVAGVGAGGAVGAGRPAAGADGSTLTGSATTGGAGAAGAGAGAAAAGAGAGAAAAGSATAVPLACAGTDGLAVAGVTAGRLSRCPLVAAAGTGPGWAAAGRGAAGRAGAAGADAEEADAPAARPEDDPNDSLSLRTTGASIVDDAERTNSPISVSLAITALLSTPISFASS